MNKTFITQAIRTPIGRFGGSLKEQSAVTLGAGLISEALKRNEKTAGKIDGVIMGNVLGAGLGQNPARQCAIQAGLGFEVPAFTLNKVCGSSLKAIDIATKEIGGGQAHILIAGGTESMSNAPYLLRNARWGYKLGDGKLIDGMITDGLWCPFNDVHMGMLVEDLTAELNIGRERQDQFALRSQQKACVAIEKKRFEDEIVPVVLTSKKKEIVFETDEHPRKDSSLEALMRLSPAFCKGGTITAGNASGINDGAALLMLASEKGLKEQGLEPMAEIIAVCEVSMDPKYFAIAPVDAVHKALHTAGLSLKDIGLFELNEAFAAQSIAVIDKLGLGMETVNVNGGAIALGHPIGASGARICVSLLHEMIKRNITYGLASLCIGSGEAMAIIIKRSA